MQLTSFASWRTKRETNTLPAHTSPWEPGGARNPADAPVPALRLVRAERPHKESAAASDGCSSIGPSSCQRPRSPTSGLPEYVCAGTFPLGIGVVLPATARLQIHWTRTVPKIVDAYPRRNVRHTIVMCFFAGEHRGLLLKPIAWPKTERTCGPRDDRVAKEGSAPTECNV